MKGEEIPHAADLDSDYFGVFKEDLMHIPFTQHYLFSQRIFKHWTFTILGVTAAGILILTLVRLSGFDGFESKWSTKTVELEITTGPSLFSGQVRSWCVDNCQDVRFVQRSSQAANQVVVQSGAPMDFDIPSDFSIGGADKRYFLTYSIVQQDDQVWSGVMRVNAGGIKLRDVKSVTFMLFRSNLE